MLIVLLSLAIVLEIVGRLLLSAQTERALEESGRTAEQQARGEFFARGGYAEFSPYRIGELRPGLTTPHFSIDDEGFRTTLLSSPTTSEVTSEATSEAKTAVGDGSEQRRAVFLMGGSTTFGVGVGDNETIAAYLQSCLDRRTPATYHVVNAGVTGYSSTEELLYLITDIRFRDPEAVVFIDGRNDIYFSTFPSWRRDAPHQAIPALRELADDSKVLIFNRPRLVLNVVDFARKSSFLTYTYRATRDSRKGFFAANTMRNPEAMSLLLENWRAAERIADGDFRTIFVLQPTLVYATDKERLDDAERSLLRDIDSGNPEYRHIVAEQYDLFKSLAADSGFSYLDLTAVFGDLAEQTYQQKYLDDCHYTPSANAVLAERICALFDDSSE